MKFGGFRLVVVLFGALALSACGGAVHPSTPAGSTHLVSRGRVDDPRVNRPDHVACMRQHGLPVALVGATGVQIGAAPAGPRVVFTPTPGAAQADQMRGGVQGAEVIGSALLFPNQGSDQELGVIESCLSQGVKG